MGRKFGGLFPGLKEDYTAAGTRRWRVRVEGDRNKLIPIPMGPEEPGFHEHYKAARRGAQSLDARVGGSSPATKAILNLCEGLFGEVDVVRTHAPAGRSLCLAGLP